MSLSIAALFCAGILGTTIGMTAAAGAQNPVTTPEQHIYNVGEVDSNARFIDDGTRPVYPAELRPLAIAGKVLAQFVVDTTGLVDTTSILTDADGRSPFATSVRSALAVMHFSAAVKNGHRVAEQVEQQFIFNPDPPQPPNVDSLLVTGGSKLDAGPAAILPGSTHPRYPEKALRAGFQGVVNAEFVIDTAGRPVPGTIKILSAAVSRAGAATVPLPSQNALLPPYGDFDAKDDFIAAVRSTLPFMRFVPARRNGTNVRQLVKQPFTFTIGP